MGITVGVVMVAVGLILSLVIKGQVNGFDIGMIGWILTGVGILSIAASLASVALSRRRTEIIDVRSVDAVVDDHHQY